jgi:hypothetical protein
MKAKPLKGAVKGPPLVVHITFIPFDLFRRDNKYFHYAASPVVNSSAEQKSNSAVAGEGDFLAPQVSLFAAFSSTADLLHC